MWRLILCALLLAGAGCTGTDKKPNSPAEESARFILSDPKTFHAKPE